MSGSQINGNFNRPSLPQVDYNQSVRSQGGVRNVQAGNVQQAPDNHPIKEVSTQLTQLLSRVSKRSTVAINLGDVEKMLHSCSRKIQKLPEFKTLMASAAKIERNLILISNLTGNEIANSFNTKTGEWTPPLKNTIETFSSLLSDLSDNLLKLVNNPKVMGNPELHELLTEKYMTNCCRESEFSSVLMQIVDLKGDGSRPISPEAKAKLSNTVKDWMIELAPHMHGTDNLSVDSDPNIKRLVSALDELKGSDSQTISADKLQQLRTLTLAAKDSVHTIAAKSTTADKTFFREAEAIFNDVLATLSNTKQAALKSIVTRHIDGCFKLPECLNVSKGLLKEIAKDKDFQPFVKYINLRREVEQCAEKLANAKLAGADTKPHLEMMKKLQTELLKHISDNRVMIHGERVNKIAVCANKLAYFAQFKFEPESVSKQIAEHLPKFSDKIVDELLDLMGKGNLGKAIDGAFHEVNAFSVHTDNLMHVLNRCQASDEESFNTRQLISTLFTKELPISALVECRANGIRDDDIDLTLCDDNIVSRKAFGAGNANTVYEVTMNDGRTYIFKPELSGRAGTTHLLVGANAYESDVNIAAINIAAQQAADYIGLGDMLVTSKVGICNGQLGFFMEKASGVETADYVAFQRGDKEELKGTHAVDFDEMDNATFLKTNGQLMKQCYKLEWADFLIGSSDRHAGNYLMDVSKDNSVKMKGIDNDMSFAKYRTSFTEITLEKTMASKFIDSCWEALTNVGSAPDDVDELFAKLNEVPGIEVSDNGAKIKFDFSKIDQVWIRGIVAKTTGIHQLIPPRVIDRELFNKLMKIDEDPNGITKYRALLEGRMNKANVEAAVNRLTTAIQYAKQLADKGAVIDNWETAKTQRNIYKEHHVRPIKTAKNGVFNEKRTEINDRYMHMGRATGNTYFRDFYSAACPRLGRIPEEPEIQNNMNNIIEEE